MKGMRVEEVAFVLHGDAWAALLALLGLDSAWMLDLPEPPDAEAGLPRLRSLGILLEDEETLMMEPVYRALAEAMSRAEVVLRIAADSGETLLFPSAQLPLLVEKLPGTMLKVQPVEHLAQLFEEAARRVPAAKTAEVATLDPAGTLWRGDMDRAAFQQWAGQVLTEGGGEAWTKSL